MFSTFPRFPKPSKTAGNNILPVVVGIGVMPAGNAEEEVVGKPGILPGTTLGMAPGNAPGTIPGTAPGTAPGIAPGTALGMTPGTVPGTVPGGGITGIVGTPPDMIKKNMSEKLNGTHFNTFRINNTVLIH